MELDYDRIRINIVAWYKSDENKETIYHLFLLLWCLMQSLNLGLLAILWSAFQVGEWAYAAYMLIYFFPALLLTTYCLLQSARRATLVEYKRLALADVQTI